MTDDLITLIKNRVGYITFNRSKVLNSFTPEFLGTLIAAIHAFEKNDEVRVIVLTGTGKAFSSGGDKAFLNALTKMTPLEIRTTVYTYFGGAAKAIKLCTKPIVASVNGPAVGAGCEIAVACDFRIVAREAFFCESWIDLGIIPPLGGMFLLPRLIGLGRASDMVMRGVRVYGEEAAAIGLANQVVDLESLEQATCEFAEDLARKAPMALSVAKEGLRRGLESTIDSEWGFNVYAQSVLLNGPDFEEAVQAMEQKRAPNF
ncbi:enoyl-CoA hydratase/isomerase family protein [Allopusillimonas ginsengisoli]|uniref:enoyl-CoA hydratase/isomerase family protein n=1 Tax=Allopusillimonas ginsengisoli TaxID=453575 RepID=UPI0014315032|nr:enoyl-CoA hydratase/isomerase family protein [Allopusillimonas ginsengisoli]